MNNKQKKDKCSELLYKDTLTLEDKKFLASIFINHPNWLQKRGVGVKDISRMKTAYGKICFQIIRKDGTSTDISFIESITPSSSLQKIKRACRTACKSEILRFRDTINWGIDKCPFSNKILYKDNTDIDHYDMSFKELFSEWIKNKDKKYLESKLSKSEDNTFEDYFIDENLNKDFLDFHNKNTHLRAVDKNINRSLLNKSKN